MANQDMLSALEFAGYDVKHAWGDGAHNCKHGAAILPDALRWLWRGYPTPIAPGGRIEAAADDQRSAARQGWQLVGEGYKFTEGPAVNAKGEVFFADVPNEPRLPVSSSTARSSCSGRRREAPTA